MGGWVKVLFVFVNVGLNILSKNQHLYFSIFSFLGMGW